MARKTDTFSSQPHKPRILLVFENPDGLFLTSKYLLRSMREAELVESRSGRDALTKLRAQSFDVIVTNHKMTEMDGVTFVRSVRQINKLVPVIMVTAMDNVAARALDVGATEFVPLTRWQDVGPVAERYLKKA
jgi:CheY-like chemotaxis protein